MFTTESLIGMRKHYDPIDDPADLLALIEAHIEANTVIAQKESEVVHLRHKIDALQRSLRAVANRVQLALQQGGLT